MDLARLDPRTTRVARPLLLGVVAGLRSQVPFALLALAASRGEFAAEADWPLRALRSRLALIGCGVAAVGEGIADKLPTTPSRLSAGPLGGRLVFGGLSGAALAVDAGDGALAGAALGLLGALGGAVGGYAARSYLGRVTGIADPWLGGVEDLVAWGLGAAATR